MVVLLVLVNLRKRRPKLIGKSEDGNSKGNLNFFYKGKKKRVDNLLKKKYLKNLKVGKKKSHEIGPNQIERLRKIYSKPLVPVEKKEKLLKKTTSSKLVSKKSPLKLKYNYKNYNAPKSKKTPKMFSNMTDSLNNKAKSPKHDSNLKRSMKSPPSSIEHNRHVGLQTSSVMLSHRKLRSFPTISNPQLLVRLNLEHNKLSDEFIKGLPSHLTFPNLKEVNFSFNKIRRLKKNFFDLFCNSEIVDLSFNKLDQVDLGFIKFKKLKVFRITGNSIQNLPLFLKYLNLQLLCIEWPTYAKNSEKYTKKELKEEAERETSIGRLSKIQKPKTRMLTLNNSGKTIQPRRGGFNPRLNSQKTGEARFQMTESSSSVKRRATFEDEDVTIDELLLCFNDCQAKNKKEFDFFDYSHLVMNNNSQWTKKAVRRMMKDGLKKGHEGFVLSMLKKVQDLIFETDMSERNVNLLITAISKHFVDLAGMLVNHLFHHFHQLIQKEKFFRGSYGHIALRLDLFDLGFYKALFKNKIDLDVQDSEGSTMIHLIMNKMGDSRDKLHLVLEQLLRYG